jgi:rRNA maturation protein Nop10
MAAIYPKTMCQLVKLAYINYLNKMNLLHIKPWPTDMSWFTSQACYDCVRCTLERACPKGIEHSMIPGQPQPQRLENKDPFKKWKETADKGSFEQILLENQTNKELSVSSQQGPHGAGEHRLGSNC